MRARATGIMVTTHSGGADADHRDPDHDERTYAPFHQHFLVARLDLDVDGTDNTVFVARPMPNRSGRTIRYGLAHAQRNTPRTEREGMVTWTSPPARLEGGEHNVVNGPGKSTRPKLVPAGRSRRCSIRPRGVPRATVIGHAVGNALSPERWPARRIRQPVGGRSRPGRVDPGEPLGSRTPTWCCGTCSHPPHHPPGVDWPIAPADVVSFWAQLPGFF